MEYRANAFYEAAQTELKDLQLIESDLRAQACEETRITVHKAGNAYQYAEYSLKDNTHHALSKSKKLRQIKRLCQAEYCEKLYKAVKEREKLLNQVLPKLQKTNLERVMSRLHPGKQVMVDDCVVDDGTYAAAWSLQEYSQKDPPANGFHTERGDLVRSKSELMIANKLLAGRIPYRYEAELRLPECTLHPDFTVLNPRTRKVYIWEHLGMAGDAEYSTGALTRLALLQKRGYLPGVNLILTVESARQPLDSRLIQKVIDAYLI